MAYILVVDDDEDIGKATAMILREDGHEVELCTDTDHAIERFRTRLPDLAVLDVMFPGNKTGGFDLARTVAKEFGKTKPVPVILLTSINQEFNLGFSARDIDDEWMPVAEFMEKPVDFDALKGKVKELLARKK